LCKYLQIKHNALVIQGGKLADIMNIILNNDFPMFVMKKIKLKSLYGTIKFRDDAGVITQKNIYIFCNYVRADGSLPGVQLAPPTLQWFVDYQFTDS